VASVIHLPMVPAVIAVQRVAKLPANGMGRQLAFR
jgi:hypothetical protein